jgi:hypothetical protein
LSPSSRPLADQLLDELLPEELDWERLVRQYPRACLLAAAGAGVWLGYSRGQAALALLGTVVAGKVAATVGEALAEK